MDAIPLPPHIKQANDARERRMQLEEQARADAKAEWMRRHSDPTSILMDQVGKLTQRLEAAELEIARQAFLLEKREP
jgi:hypothetical protein